MRRLALLLLVPSLASAQVARDTATVRDRLRLYYVGYPIGWEQYELTRDGAGGYRYTSDFDYTDRGRRTHLVAAARLSGDFSPQRLEISRVTDTSRTVETLVDVKGKRAHVLSRGREMDVAFPKVIVAIGGATPVSQHLLLLRYWASHGRPHSLAAVPGGPTNTITITIRGRDTLDVAGRRAVLDRYAVDGVTWGVESVWLDQSGRLAALTTTGGGLTLDAVREDLEPQLATLMASGTRDRMTDLARMTRTVTPLASGSVALVGATLIDGTGAPPVTDATVVVRNGAIVAAGARATTPIPRGARRIDVSGRTIMPGLWDMHTHVMQMEWAPVYLAAGVTTVRDMGNNLYFIVPFRDAVTAHRTLGPRTLVAGLVDGGGPSAFGAINATTPEEGRAVVRRYHDLGFEQIKLYDLVAPAVVGAIITEAHRLGMSVTGHVPRALGLLASVDSGMDQIAHLPIRGDTSSDSVKAQIASLRRHGTVVDPTAAWGELLQHSTAEPVSALIPGVVNLPPILAQRVNAMGIATVDTATAHARMRRTLGALHALHAAGVPLVAGTDEGVPGLSVYREVELYVAAGIPPMEALRAATAVPAKVMGLDRTLGTIEVGKRADLIVLDQNPLEDIRNLQHVRLVMKDGVLYRSDDLWRAAGFKTPAVEPVAPQPSADLVLLHGTILTVDPGDHVAQAVAISGDRIVAVGNDAAIAKFIGPRTRRIDLHGLAVTPGLIDAHAHFSTGGADRLYLLDVSYPGVKTVGDVARLLQDRVAKTRPGTFISGRGWDDGKLAERRLLVARDLDAASPANPVYLVHTTGHFGVANSAALALAHVTRETPDPPNGTIDRYPDGTPTGVLKESAQELVRRLIPSRTAAQVEAGMRDLAKGFNAEGMTSVKDPTVTSTTWASYGKVLAEGALTVRVFALWLGGRTEAAAQQLISERAAMSRPYVSTGDDRLVSGGVKLYIDGSGGARTAWLYDDWNKDYTGVDAGNRGYPASDPDTVRHLIRLFHDAGMHVSVHSIGDRGIDWVVDSYAEAMRANPINGLRHGIIHANIPSDHAIDVMAMLQRDHDAGYPEPSASFTWWLGDAYASNFGPVRSLRLNPFRTFLSKGVLWANGSDFPVTPFAARYGIWSAVAREPLLGAYAKDPFGRTEAIDVHAALRAVTLGAAHQLFLERKVGSIEVGKYADLAVWDRNVYVVPTDQIQAMQCQMTIFNGKVVYRAPRSAVRVTN